MEPKICRTCLTNPGTVPLFVKQDDILLSVKIMQCVNLNITQEDGLPDHICTNCESELAIAHNFIDKCLDADKRLREGSSIQILTEDKLNINIKDEYEDFEAPYDEPYFTKNDINLELNKRKSIHNGNIKKKTYKRKTIKCEECGLKVLSSSAMKLHKRVHTGEKPFCCPDCNKKFSREENLSRHLMQHIRGRKKYERRAKIEKAAPVQCNYCGLLVKTPSAMVIHLRTHTGERPFACDSCTKTFRTKGSLKRHIETNHLDTSQRERKFICEMCGRSFYRKNEIITHIRIHTGEKPYACPFCPMRFLQISSLIRHKRTHTGDKPYSCPICGKCFADKSLTNIHLAVHSDERKFKCHLCNKGLKSKNSLTTHLKIHSNTKDIVCSACGLTFSTKGNLKLHTIRVHSEKSGQCSVCLKNVSNIETHMRKHTGEKPFTCEMCSRSFGSKVSLTMHISFKHEKSGKYKCSIGDCKKTFPIPSMLEFHLLKYHTNHTPHVCHVCSRGFFRLSDLSRHLRVSHMELPVLVKVKSPVD